MTSVKHLPAMQETWRSRFDPRVEKVPWRRKRQTTPVFLPGKSQGQRSLVGYSPWGHKRVGHDWAAKPPQQNIWYPSSFPSQSACPLWFVKEVWDKRHSPGTKVTVDALEAGLTSALAWLNLMLMARIRSVNAQLCQLLNTVSHLCMRWSRITIGKGGGQTPEKCSCVSWRKGEAERRKRRTRRRKRSWREEWETRGGGEGERRKRGKRFITGNTRRRVSNREHSQ